jgi:hypothetical protein
METYSGAEGPDISQGTKGQYQGGLRTPKYRCPQRVAIHSILAVNGHRAPKVGQMDILEAHFGIVSAEVDHNIVRFHIYSQMDRHC